MRRLIPAIVLGLAALFVVAPVQANHLTAFDHAVWDEQRGPIYNILARARICMDASHEDIWNVQFWNYDDLGHTVRFKVLATQGSTQVYYDHSVVVGSMSNILVYPGTPAVSQAYHLAVQVYVDGISRYSLNIWDPDKRGSMTKVTAYGYVTSCV